MLCYLIITVAYYYYLNKMQSKILSLYIYFFSRTMSLVELDLVLENRI